MDTMTFAMTTVYRGIRLECTGAHHVMPTAGATNDAWFARRQVLPTVSI